VKFIANYYGLDTNMAKSNETKVLYHNVTRHRFANTEMAAKLKFREIHVEDLLTNFAYHCITTWCVLCTYTLHVEYLMQVLFQSHEKCGRTLLFGKKALLMHNGGKDLLALHHIYDVIEIRKCPVMVILKDLHSLIMFWRKTWQLNVMTC